jgi:hypothetical protein
LRRYGRNPDRVAVDLLSEAENAVHELVCSTLVLRATARTKGNQFGQGSTRVVKAVRVGSSGCVARAPVPKGILSAGTGHPSMDFTLTQDFPAGLDRLWTAFGRPDYPLQKYLALGATAVRVRRFDATAQAIEVELERDVPVDTTRLPPWTRVLVRSEQTLRHRTAWRRVGPTRVAAELDISPVGLPVRAHGGGTIVEPATGTTRMVLTWRVASMLGEKVERLFADQIRAALDDDHRFTLQYLKRAQVR